MITDLRYAKCRTPKALANFSPGLFQPWETEKGRNINSERVRETPLELSIPERFLTPGYKPWARIRELLRSSKFSLSTSGDGVGG